MRHCLGVNLFLLATLVFAPGVQAESWVSAWFMAPQAVPQAADAPPWLRPPLIEDATVRQLVRPTLSGSALRLRISNRYGTKPLYLDRVTVGVARGIGGVVPGSLHKATFAGRNAVTIMPGKSALSDPVHTQVVGGRLLAVSLYVPGSVRPRTWHQIAGRVNFLSRRGDHAMNVTGTAFVHRNTHIFWLDGVDILAPRSWAVVAIGDSITDGLKATLNAHQRWPDALSERLRAAGFDHVAVLNAGISGNRLLHDSACYGQRLESRFVRDALKRAGVRAVIVLIGVNDINFGYVPPSSGLDCDARHVKVTASALIEGYRRLIAQARAHGVKIYAGTLTPAALPPEREAIRTRVNAWIRNSRAFDGVVDFDAALRDPHQPSRLLPRADSGDGIHPGDEGDKMMAAAVPLAWFASGP